MLICGCTYDTGRMGATQCGQSLHVVRMMMGENHVGQFPSRLFQHLLYWGRFGHIDKQGFIAFLIMREKRIIVAQTGYGYQFK